MRDLRNIVNTRPIYARKLSNFAVVPHKRDVGLNWGNYNRAKTEYTIDKDADYYYITIGES